VATRGARPQPDPTGPGQESVWDYPRPPLLQPTTARIRVELGGVVVADTVRALRVLETSHPPSYYLPPADCTLERFAPAQGRSFCEWKGEARYWTVTVGDRVAERATWSYPDPSPSFSPLRDHLAFYPAAFECFVDGERVTPQPGGFYGGWVTSAVAGPVKGPPGTEWW
jgi:uncharacterized protein (DUF427 family)